MPAQLRVQVPGQPPFQAWIQTEVVRIGSGHSDTGDTVDIQIDGLPHHLITVVFRNGGYWLANRSPCALPLARRIVQPGEIVTWRDGATLALEAGIQITLACQEDPRPLRHESWRPEPDFQLVERVREERRRQRVNAWCFAVALLAVFITAVIVSRRPENWSLNEHERLEAILDGSSAAEQNKCRGVRDQLRSAFSLEQQGDVNGAGQAYRQARDLMKSITEPDLTAKVRNELLSYIVTRIDSI